MNPRIAKFNPAVATTCYLCHTENIDLDGTWMMGHMGNGHMNNVADGQWRIWTMEWWGSSSTCDMYPPHVSCLILQI